MRKIKVKAARRGKKTSEAIEAEGMPPPVEPKPCIECGKRPARKGDKKCMACYMRGYRKRRPQEVLPDGSLNTAYVKAKLGGEEPTVEQLFEEMKNLPTLTQAEVDHSVIRASLDAGALAATPPEHPSLGYQRLWVYLRRFDAHFRRQAIARMQALGMDRLAILAAFVSDPKLRACWIDPLRNPLRALERDFKLLAKKKPRGKAKPQEALRAYTERLLLLERMALDLAANEKAAIKSRQEMIQFAAKLGRDIALLEDAIKIVPAQGDVPTRRAQRGIIQSSETEEEDDGGEELDETESGEYELPEIETGKR